MLYIGSYKKIGRNYSTIQYIILKIRPEQSRLQQACGAVVHVKSW